jgi:hypothetical protein
MVETKQQSTKYLGAARKVHDSLHGSHLLSLDLGMVEDGIGMGMVLRMRRRTPLVPVATTLPAVEAGSDQQDGCCRHPCACCCTQSILAAKAFPAYEAFFLASKAFPGQNYCTCSDDPQSSQTRSCMNPSGTSHISLSLRS